MSDRLVDWRKCRLFRSICCFCGGLLVPLMRDDRKFWLVGGCRPGLCESGGDWLNERILTTANESEVCRICRTDGRGGGWDVAKFRDLWTHDDQS